MQAILLAEIRKAKKVQSEEKGKSRGKIGLGGTWKGFCTAITSWATVCAKKNTLICRGLFNGITFTADDLKQV